jgi:hypothetical protein
MPAPSHSSAYVVAGPSRATVATPLPLTKRVVVGPVMRYPRERAGTRAIAGEVDIGTTPVAGRIVRAYDRATGLLLRQVTTDSAGLYSFADLDGRYTYYVVALDTQPGGNNAAVADYLTPT